MPPDLPGGLYAPGALAYDMMYGAAPTAFMKQAGADGARARRTAWACWWARRPRASISGTACGPIPSRAGGAARRSGCGTLKAWRAAPAGRRSWFRIITGVMMALVCAVLLYQFWLFGAVVWYKYQTPAPAR